MRSWHFFKEILGLLSLLEILNGSVFQSLAMQPCTHGDSYMEAAKNAQEVIELLVESALEAREPLPIRQQFQAVPVPQAA